MKNRSILIVSESDDKHVEIVAQRLSDRAIPFFRLNSDELLNKRYDWSISNSTAGNINSWYYPEATTVWYRCRTLIPIVHDNPVNSLVRQENDGLLQSILGMYRGCRWINSLAALAVARPKLLQLEVAKRTGFSVPNTLVTSDLASLQEFYRRNNDDIVIKPLQAQVVEITEASFVLGTRKIEYHELPSAVMNVPCFAQKRLKIKEEVRVIVFGEDCYAFKMVKKVEADDIKQLSLDDIEHEYYQLDSDIIDKLRRIVKSYGLVFAAIDLVVTSNGDMVFLEVNPNGQWLWLQYMTDFDLLNPFVDFLTIS